jgi:YVTN family beta-propeller protein
MKPLLSLLLLSTAAAFAQAPSLLVLAKGSSELLFCSPSGQRLAQVAVGAHPHEIVFSPDGRFAYTSDNGTMRIEQAGTGGNTVSILSIPDRKKIGEISLGRFRRPHGLALDPASGLLAVTTELPDQLLLVDVNQKRISRTFDTKGKTSHMVALSADGKFAYISNSNSSNVSVVDLSSGAVKLLAMAARPEGSTRSRDGRHIYVVNREGAAITIIDTATNEVSGTIRTGTGPVRIAEAPDGKLVYALIHDRTVEVADPVTRRVLKVSHILDGDPVSLNLSRDGTRAYASVEDRNLVYTLSLPDLRVIYRFQLPEGTGPDPVVEMPGR